MNSNSATQSSDLTVEKILRSSIRVSVTKTSGEQHYGTAFFFNFMINQSPYPVLISNRHVFENASEMSFFVNASCSNLSWAERCKHNEKKHLIYALPKIIFHPNPDIDLALFPMETTINQFAEQGISFVHWYLDESIIPSAQEWSRLLPLEDVIMVGCPDAIFDLKNNLALIRKGIIASHPAYDFNYKPVFISDIACFPGSSGSPILMRDTSPFFSDETLYLDSSRYALLGIQSRVFQHSENYFNNLAIAIKSTELLAFRNLLWS
ncbi:putative phage tail component domain protein [Marvinbryantia formatexigens DSM 14469]|uniref:Phage tail component domain protein n=1 Tax=Marvinbryantia formatexigens DSM 14469 TaxID=478749 RepID=C6LG12_9FIRM|nr:serine protease [Marvinbryantia formatexigens]EET60376.1 putative phage tail component domain protein [Marvinbryantia formatexigens DSM 14469]UWO25283.1 serine protease [Marvinbryantia formatexigens DSM 14469]SDH02950.1 hypothetical protein SAMN05660368_03704 [Marvinbryantia formatexigens]